jgi:HEAT repeat protein
MALEVVMSVRTLVKKLYSDDKAARIAAIRSLGRAGAATAIPDLMELVDDPYENIAGLFLRALAVLAPANLSAQARYNAP